MFLWLILSTALAQDPVGEISEASSSVQVQRAGETLTLQSGDDLEAGDIIESSDAQVVIYPDHQVNLAGKIEIKEALEDKTELALEKGKVHVKVEKQTRPLTFRVVTPMAAFGVRGTEFEVEETDEGSDLQVVEGEVEAQDKQGQIQRVRPREAIRLMKRGGFQKREFRELKQRFKFKQKEEIKERRIKRREKRVQELRSGQRPNRFKNKMQSQEGGGQGPRRRNR